MAESATIETIMADLRNLREQSGSLLYDKAKKASELLEHREWSIWVANTHKGNEAEARDHIMQEFFSEYHKHFCLNEIIDILRRFASRNEWKKHKFNLNVMIAILQEENKVSRPRKPSISHSYKQLYQEEAAKVNKLAEDAATYKTKTEQLEDYYKKRTDHLESLVRELEIKLASTEGELNAMRKLVEGMRLERPSKDKLRAIDAA